MLDVEQGSDDDNYSSEKSYSRHDLNISRALFIAINNEDLDSMMFINIVRVVIGHRVLLSKGGQRKQAVQEDDNCGEVNLTEDDEIVEIMNDLK